MFYVLATISMTEMADVTVFLFIILLISNGVL